MSDTDDKSSSPSSVPSWQHGAAAQSTSRDEPPRNQGSQPDQVEIARHFLQEEHVKSSSRERKIEFLKSKGLKEADIVKLLGQSQEPIATISQQEKDRPLETKQTSPSTDGPAQSNTATDRPPIVTYPEFLVKPERPPPLVTKNGLIDILYVFAGLSTILYGTSKYLIAPMVDNLTEARTELHDVAVKRLDNLVAQLERMVSVIPSAVKRPIESDEKGASDDEDPSELFHRDVGTQTSLIDRTCIPAAKAEEQAAGRHADSLASLTKTLSVLKDQFRAQSEGFKNVKTLLDVFRDDLDGMIYGGATEFVGGYDVYGTSKKNEPEDEIRKVRDNIRRVKGVLLSTRNFPALTR